MLYLALGKGRREPNHAKVLARICRLRYGMQTVYLLLSGASCLYFIRREFDLFTICFYSSTIYFAPALFGYTCYDWRSSELYPVSTRAYVFYIFYITALVVSALVFGRGSWRNAQADLSRNPNAIRSKSQATLLRGYRGAFLTTCALLVMTLASGSGPLFASSKQDLLDNAPSTLPFFQGGIVLFGSTALILGRRRGIALAFALCAFDLAMGFRGATAFVLLVGITWLGYKWRGTPRGRSYRLALPFLFILLYLGSATISGIAAAIRQSALGMGFGDLGTAEWLGPQIQYTEAFSRQAIFDRVINADIVLPWSYFTDLFRVLVPKVHEVFGSPNDFNAVFQPLLFPEIPWGMASNIWAEQFCIGGEIWLTAFTLFVFATIGIANRYILSSLSKGHYAGAALLTILAVPAIFYMHRNGLVYQSKLVRDSALIALICFILGSLHHELHSAIYGKFHSRFRGRGASDTAARK